MFNNCIPTDAEDRHASFGDFVGEQCAIEGFAFGMCISFML
ncbi:MAG: hypothetical protein R3C05_12180 [Pirellulaceae bacterium]